MKREQLQNVEASTFSITNLKILPATKPVMPADIKRMKNDARPSRRSTGIGEDGLERLEALEAQYEGAEELPEDVDQRLGEIEAIIEAIDERPFDYPPEEVARAGVFISIDQGGCLRIERGFVRPEDEPPVEVAAPTEGGDPAINDGVEGEAAHMDEANTDDEEAEDVDAARLSIGV